MPNANYTWIMNLPLWYWQCWPSVSIVMGVTFQNWLVGLYSLMVDFSIPKIFLPCSVIGLILKIIKSLVALGPYQAYTKWHPWIVALFSPFLWASRMVEGFALREYVGWRRVPDLHILDLFRGLEVGWNYMQKLCQPNQNKKGYVSQFAMVPLIPTGVWPAIPCCVSVTKQGICICYLSISFENIKLLIKMWSNYCAL